VLKLLNQNFGMGHTSLFEWVKNGMGPVLQDLEYP